MRVRQPNPIFDDVNVHHEAGHACLMVMFGVPIFRFVRYQTWDLSISEIPIVNAVKDEERLYVDMVVRQASRATQPMSLFHRELSVTDQERAFKKDAEQIERVLAQAYQRVSPHWPTEVRRKLTLRSFAAQAAVIVERETQHLFANETLVETVKRVAQHLKQVARIRPGALSGDYDGGLLEEDIKAIGAAVVKETGIDFPDLAYLEIFESLCRGETD